MSHQYTTPQLTSAIAAVILWHASFLCACLWLGLIPFALSPAILWPASLDQISHLACNMIPHDNEIVWYKLALGSYLLMRTFKLATTINFPRYNVVLTSWDSFRNVARPAYLVKYSLEWSQFFNTTLQSEFLVLSFCSMGWLYISLGK